MKLEEQIVMGKRTQWSFKSLHVTNWDLLSHKIQSTLTFNTIIKVSDKSWGYNVKRCVVVRLHRRVCCCKKRNRLCWHSMIGTEIHACVHMRLVTPFTCHLPSIYCVYILALATESPRLKHGEGTVTFQTPLWISGRQLKWHF